MSSIGWVSRAHSYYNFTFFQTKIEYLNVYMYRVSQNKQPLVPIVVVEEVSMNEKCHRTKSFLSATLPYRSNYNVSQESQKETLSVTIGLHRNYIYKEVSQKENFFFIP